MRNRVLAVYIVINLCLLSFNVSGQTTMTDLVSYALEHSRDIKKSELLCKEADYIYKEARGRGLPQLSASASYSKMILPDMGLTSETYSAIEGMADMMINAFSKNVLLVLDCEKIYNYVSNRYEYNFHPLLLALESVAWDKDGKKFDPIIPNDDTDALTYALAYYFVNPDNLYLPNKQNFYERSIE